MRFDRLPPGEELNAGAETVPRQAASVILVRGGHEALELLLVRRTPEAHFMGGFWVFPGGAVDAHEGEGDASHRAAAVRELEEETAVAGIEPDELVKFSRWITPREVTTRYDTHFFVAHAPDGARPRVDGDECVDLGWYTPRGALDAHHAGDLPLVFPTVKQLEQLEPFPTAQALIDHARRHEVRPVTPRLVMEGEMVRVLLPGEPGFEEAR